jgi:hypothetical protein
MTDLPTYRELKEMSDDALIDLYDESAAHTVVTPGFYLDELARRHQSRQSNEIASLSYQMTDMTRKIQRLTAANAVLVSISLFVLLISVIAQFAS